MFLKSLASLIVSKHDDIPFSVVMNRLRTRISFCLLRWCITCFRGCRSSYTSRRLPGGFANVEALLSLVVFEFYFVGIIFIIIIITLDYYVDLHL